MARCSSDRAALVAMIAVLFAARAASANGGGVAGYSGKPNGSAPQGDSCNRCHSGGAAPQISITGPASLGAGQAAEYALVVQTGSTRAAAGIAATNGVTLTPVSGLRDSFGELVQDSALAVSGGQATFRFRVTAPAAGGTIKIWAVGLACNGAGTGGDRAAHATRDVAVTSGSTSSGSSGASSSGSSGASSSGSSGTSSSGSSGAATSGGAASTSGTSASSASTSDDDDDGAEEADDADDAQRARARRLAVPRSGSCTASASSASVDDEGNTLRVVAVGAIALGALVVRRRRSPALAASTALVVIGLPACTGELAPEERRSSDAVGEGTATTRVDTSAGRDDSLASCWAACQNTSFACRAKSGANASTSLGQLSPTASGCRGMLQTADGERAVDIDCYERRACVAARPGETPSCTSALFSATSFAWVAPGASSETVCTRVASN